MPQMIELWVIKIFYQLETAAVVSKHESNLNYAIILYTPNIDERQKLFL
jgi:hypothetical protein